MSPIVFSLRVYLRVSVDFRSRSNEEFRSSIPRTLKRIAGAHHSCLDGAYWIALIVHRTCRTGQMVNLVALDVPRIAHIVTQKLEVSIVKKVSDILPMRSEHIVEADNLVFPIFE